MEGDKPLSDFNLSEEKDKLIRFKIGLSKSKLGCGQRFEYGNYINGEICTEDCTCNDCDREFEKNESAVSSQETLILSIKLAKNSDIIGRIKHTLVSDSSYEKQIIKLRGIINE